MGNAFGAYYNGVIDIFSNQDTVYDRFIAILDRKKLYGANNVLIEADAIKFINAYSDFLFTLPPYDDSFGSLYGYSDIHCTHKITPLVAAIKAHYTQLTKLIIDKIYDISPNKLHVLDAVDDYNNNALMHAVFNEDLNIVNYLLAAGANPNITNKNEYTAVLYASLYGNNDLVELLCAYHVDLDVVDKYNMTALKYAVSRGYDDVALTLIDAGACISIDYSFAIDSSTPSEVRVELNPDRVSPMKISRGSTDYFPLHIVKHIQYRCRRIILETMDTAADTAIYNCFHKTRPVGIVDMICEYIV
ncbi:MAG: putative ankyrin repeat and SOCS box protein 15 isoform X1 [Faunusvirus sp.]|jgi:hypothetical protein|uniref:Putative ankyrin repeat and SOCS box protein 15 isoform X1 n=1 Tax=Faunusvirus sp. TaxID=2487766 RepID=A0A3G5A0Y3_9VIRU|nr:MAG: putative ankyrin repeat and SOCS box protein 15 isoform X1 [Faunusvirus sp.]